MPQASNPIVARPKRLPCVFVCAKCAKKVAAGRAIRKTLKSALAEQGDARGRKPGRLVETKCLGLCPKGAVTLATAASLGRGELLGVKSATDVPAALLLMS